MYVLVQWRVPFETDGFPLGITPEFYKPTWEPVDHVTEMVPLLKELFDKENDQTRRMVTNWLECEFPTRRGKEYST